MSPLRRFMAGMWPRSVAIRQLREKQAGEEVE